MKSDVEKCGCCDTMSVKTKRMSSDLSLLSEIIVLFFSVNSFSVRILDFQVWPKDIKQVLSIFFILWVK